MRQMLKAGAHSAQGTRKGALRKWCLSYEQDEEKLSR